MIRSIYNQNKHCIFIMWTRLNWSVVLCFGTSAETTKLSMCRSKIKIHDKFTFINTFSIILFITSLTPSLWLCDFLAFQRERESILQLITGGKSLLTIGEKYLYNDRVPIQETDLKSWSGHKIFQIHFISYNYLNLYIPNLIVNWYFVYEKW